MLNGEKRLGPTHLLQLPTQFQFFAKKHSHLIPTATNKCTMISAKPLSRCATFVTHLSSALLLQLLQCFLKLVVNFLFHFVGVALHIIKLRRKGPKTTINGRLACLLHGIWCSSGVQRLFVGINCS